MIKNVVKYFVRNERLMNILQKTNGRNNSKI